MGLVAYRDIGDDYVTKKIELTRDIQDLYANLLELKARGGGDWPESVNEALDVAVNKLQWTHGGDVRRIVFLVGDAPPHMDYAQDTKYPVTLSVAKQKDIIVNAVLAGNAADTERVWRDIAQNGNGRFIPIPQDGGQVVVIETPYDEDIIILQREINGTVIPYGPRAHAEAHRRQDQAIVARWRRQRPRKPPKWRASSTSAPRRPRKPSPAMATWSPTSRAGRSSFSAIKEEDLPDNLRAMKPEQRMDEVNRQMNQRKELNEKLGSAGGEARQIRRRCPRQGAAKGVVVRPRGRGYAEGADQAVKSLRILCRRPGSRPGRRSNCRGDGNGCPHPNAQIFSLANRRKIGNLRR